MEARVFDRIVKELAGSDAPRAALHRLAEEWPEYVVPYETLVAIYTQTYQLQTRMRMHVHKRQTNIDSYVQRYQEGEELISIAKSIDLAPCLLARIILRETLSMSPKDITQCLREPALVDDERLRNQLVRCVESDEHYSPSSERIRSALGLEYEFVLYESLFNTGVPFDSEDDLRREGRPKTPDVRLRSPIAVRGRIVNWIDSKAMFGDVRTLADCQNQVRGYVHRYGPGMIIFWFGYVQEVDSDPDIILSHGFPDLNDVKCVC
ncbi:unnamed protein product (mitochondrion) [Plasmodiophora brassicae]|uniref:CDAN1-interacting nuclease 1 n=1 Tax=Plasmodiophora brassicae TaxID=37360 RepID=A0A3P3YCX7_PLABS|nr:unnamed protein product [Plasmodiophora brassicae]